MKQILLILGLSLLASSAFAAGGVDGGGGNAVVCRDEQGVIKSARMLDLYEGEFLHGLKYEYAEFDIDQKLDDILSIIYDGATSQYESQKRLFQSVKDSFKLLAPGISLKPIDDSGHIFVPGNCKVEQVANFYNQFSIYIVSDIYNAFSTLDKLALIMHEAIYLQERENGIENSKYARRVVAHLLSKGFIPDPIYEGLNYQDAYACSSYRKEDNRIIVNVGFLAYKNNGHWIFNFQIINGHGVYSKKYLKAWTENDIFPMDAQNAPNSRMLYALVSSLHGKIDPHDIVRLSLIPQGILVGPQTYYMGIGFQGFDPQDRGEDYFTCRKLDYHL